MSNNEFVLYIDQYANEIEEEAINILQRFSVEDIIKGSITASEEDAEALADEILSQDKESLDLKCETALDQRLEELLEEIAEKVEETFDFDALWEAWCIDDEEFELTLIENNEFNSFEFHDIEFEQEHIWHYFIEWVTRHHDVQGSDALLALIEFSEA